MSQSKVAIEQQAQRSKKSSILQRYSMAWWSLAMFPLFYSVLANWLITTRFGTAWMLFPELGYPVLFVLCLFITPFLGIGLFFQQTNRASIILLLGCFLFLVSLPSGLFIGHKTRMLALRDVTSRNSELIAGIKAYEKDHGNPPYALEDLVPKYLARPPNTGMRAYPNIRYHWRDGSKLSQDNGWWLELPMSKYPFNWDSFIYAAKQKYPYHFREGSLERVGDWAYLHE